MMISRKDGAIDYRENTTFHFTLFEFSRWSIRLNLSWLFHKYTDYVTCLKRWDWGTLMNKLMGTKRITLNCWIFFIMLSMHRSHWHEWASEKQINNTSLDQCKKFKSILHGKKKEGVSKLLHWYGNYMLLDWYSCE